MIFSVTYNQLKILHFQSSDALNKHFLKSNLFNLEKCMDVENVWTTKKNLYA